jgi:hypothetical protein
MYLIYQIHYLFSEPKKKSLLLYIHDRREYMLFLQVWDIDPMNMNKLWLVDTWICEIKMFSKFVAMKSDWTSDSPIERRLNQSSQNVSPWSHNKCKVHWQCNSFQVFCVSVSKNWHTTVERNLVSNHHYC